MKSSTTTSTPPTFSTPSPRRHSATSPASFSTNDRRKRSWTAPSSFLDSPKLALCSHGAMASAQITASKTATRLYGRLQLLWTASKIAQKQKNCCPRRGLHPKNLSARISASFLKPARLWSFGQNAIRGKASWKRQPAGSVPNLHRQSSIIAWTKQRASSSFVGTICTRRTFGPWRGHSTKPQPTQAASPLAETTLMPSPLLPTTASKPCTPTVG
mmetsp:Transcript_24271/g.52577  ORF Transcript_24271/g.52577 Transcript_24271/m.52577 type:complete len:215 (+) Transcript_24271:934-1578(+)